MPVADSGRVQGAGLIILDAGAGDAGPLIAIAAVLMRRGQPCEVLASEQYRAAALSRQVSFQAVEYTPVAVFDAGGRELLPGLTALAEYFARLDRTRATLLVNIDSGAPSNLLAERHGIRTVRLYLAPTRIRSLSSPAWPLRARTLGHLGYTFPKYQLPRLLQAADRDPAALRLTNRSRLLLGLPPLDDLSRADARLMGHVALFPAWYAERGADWPDALECVGFVRPPAAPPQLEPLARPLALEGRPCVVVISGEPDANRLGIECCKELGRPTLLLGASSATLLTAGGRSCGTVTGLELEVALQHAALLVHAGDTAATARALRAGVPQLCLPVLGDQPDNAQRVFELGVGRYLAVRRADSRAIALAARALLDDAAIASAAQAISRRLASEEDGAERAAALLERQASCSAAPLPPGIKALASVIDAEPRARTAAGRTILFLIWPEPGHVAVPLSLARRVSARGDRVVFACLDARFVEKLSSLGYESVDLSQVPAWESEETAENLGSSEADALRIAALRLANGFEAAVERYRPSAVLIDTLYSGMGLLPEGAGVPWAIYETDLMREYDPLVPPRDELIVPGREDSPQRLRDAWLASLRKQKAQQKEARSKRPQTFPRDIVAALEHRCGATVRFERHLCKPPVARVPRMVFAPRAFDFPRERTEKLATWVGSCIDDQRCEPSFPWHRLPPKPLAYCAFGTQSLRDRQAPALLEVIADVFSRRDDLFLVLVCPAQHLPAAARGKPNILAVEEAPQLSLLRRASLALTHAGFNSVKECAAQGVPMIALPLSQEQPRNAALIEFHGLGVAIDTTRRALGAAELDAAVTRVSQSAHIRASCGLMQRHFQDPGFDAALRFIDTLTRRGLHARARWATPPASLAPPSG